MIRKSHSLFTSYSRPKFTDFSFRLFVRLLRSLWRVYEPVFIFNLVEQLYLIYTRPDNVCVRNPKTLFIFETADVVVDLSAIFKYTDRTVVRIKLSTIRPSQIGLIKLFAHMVLCCLALGPKVTSQNYTYLAADYFKTGPRVFLWMRANVTHSRALIRNRALSFHLFQ